MRLLAFDTSTRATTVALCGGERDPIEARDDPPAGARPGHALRLLPLVSEVLERAGWGWNDLERIAVGRGPGTFTGLRIGIATARGLAASLGIPLVAVSTLESLALPGADAGARSVLAVLDARRSELFAASWELRDGAWTRVQAPQVVSPARLPGLVEGLPEPLALGDGAVECREILEHAGATVPPERSELHRVSAAIHCRLAQGAPAARPEDVLPEYLRLPDAEIARRAAIAEPDER